MSPLTAPASRRAATNDPCGAIFPDLPKALLGSALNPIIPVICREPLAQVQKSTLRWAGWAGIASVLVGIAAIAVII